MLVLQVDQSNSTTNLLSQKPQTLVEQVFNSGLFKQKESSLVGGMTSGKVMEPRLSEGRGRPIWTLHDRESPISPLNMQVYTVRPSLTYKKAEILPPGFEEGKKPFLH